MCVLQGVDGYYQDRSTTWNSRGLEKNWRKSSSGQRKPQELTWRSQDGQQDQSQQNTVSVNQTWRWQQWDRPNQPQHESLATNQKWRKSASDLRTQTLTWRHQQDEQEDPQHGIVQVTPHLLVECLSEFPSFTANLLLLKEKMNAQLESILEVASKNSKLFCTNSNRVQLKPQISMCNSHCGSQGCQNRSSCSDLHICPKYVYLCCRVSNCPLGHKWTTDHNMYILKSLCLENLSFPTLRKLVQLVSKQEFSDVGKLDVCRRYNEGHCNQPDCEALHICMTYITGLTRCSRVDCQLSHNLQSNWCFQLLRYHGLPTNETSRDIVMALLTSNGTLAKTQQSLRKEIKEQQETSDETVKNGQITKPDEKLPEKDQIISKDDHVSKVAVGSNSNIKESSSSEQNTENNSTNITPPITSRTFESKDNIVETEQSPDSAQTTPKPICLGTMWSHDLEGDVPIPEICYDSVEGVCKYEKTGCQRLHASKHYHWQFCEQGGHWTNLQLNHVNCLERSFCDPAQDDVYLPQLDPSTLDRSVRNLLILMGRHTWIANFKDLILTNPSKQKTFELRRLCTESTSEQVIKAAHFVWYFLDNNKTWVQYGKADTSGATHLISKITTDDIEQHYQLKKTVPLVFNNSRFTYCLNPTTMKQVNLKTKMIRDVRRRPEPHLLQEQTMMDHTNCSDLPSYWEAMQPDEMYKLVSLTPSSAEYQVVVGLLGVRISRDKVQNIQRVQNLYLWYAFNNKIKEMTAVYKDAAIVNVRQLFHGTTSDIVEKICHQNFDWRLHGSRSGQSFGQGTYFSTDAAYSYKYCRPDDLMLKHLFVARTAVGTTIRGDSSMVRPPLNSATDRPYDSTTNGSLNPSIIVKYDKQEYYPEYIITLL